MLPSNSALPSDSTLPTTVLLSVAMTLVSYHEDGRGGRLVLQPCDKSGQALGTDPTVYTVAPGDVLTMRQALLTATPGTVFTVSLGTP
jgi:hypothetical protein